MEHGRPSRTAQRVALRRAAHQLLDAPLVFEDPLALKVVGREDAAALLANPSHLDLTPFDRGLRAFAAARSRIVEDHLANAACDGLGQLVVLGAGLDTFACRNPYDGLRVFEVDHPDTQAWKRSRLADEGIEPPRSMTFVPVDFQTMDVFEQLRASGFESDQPAAFSWLGVVTYLERAAITSMLRRIAAMPSGTFVVFDYAVSPDLLTPGQRAVLEAAAAKVAAIGEPFVTFFHPQDLDEELRSLGFGVVEDLGTDAINERYFSARRDGLCAGGMARIVIAMAGEAERAGATWILR